MKNRVLTLLLLSCLPWLLWAQSNDDLYFVPKKEKKAEINDKSRTVLNNSSETVVNTRSVNSVVVKDMNGNIRDIDEYNRQYTSRDNNFTYSDGTLYIEEKPYSERGEWVNGFQGSDMDYEYAMRIIRFRNPRYAIPVSSPLYWDVVYGAWPSWNWNVYDDGMYAYVFPTFSNSLWWDWRWSSGFYAPGWSFSIGWHSPWYYSHWYSPWCGGYWGYHHPWGGYWGHSWYYHNYYHYPHYGWNSGWRRTGHTDYRPGRYQAYSSGSSYTRPSSGISSSSSSVRRSQSAQDISSGRARTSAIRRSSVGRVVTGSENRGNSAVRPDRNGVTSSVGNVSRYGNSSSSRRSTGVYTRPSSTRIDRTGTNYNRPSSTRRSSDYNSNSIINQGSVQRYSTRSSDSYNRNSGSVTRSSGSSISRSSGSSISRSSGGSVSRSSGGSRRR